MKIIYIIFYVPISLVLNFFSIKFIYMKWPNAIGHIIHEPNLFLRECYLKNKKYKFKILLLPAKNVANKHYAKFYLSKDFIVISNNLFCKILYPFSILGFCYFDPSRYFTNTNTNDPIIFNKEMKNLEIYKILHKTYKNKSFKLTLNLNDKKKSKELIQKLKLDTYKYYICIHFRDPSYRDNKYSARDTIKIENYLPLIKKLVSENIAVVRVGRSNLKLSESFQIKGFFDYSNSTIVSDENDILLIANSKFFLGTNSGAAVIADIFDVDIGCCNFTPFSKPADYNGYYYYPKIIRRINGDVVPFEEVLKSEISNSYDLEIYKKKNYIASDNSSDEIMEFYKECKDRLNNKYHEDPVEKKLRVRFQNLRKKNNFYYPHGSIISGHFLKKYQNYY